MIMMIMREHSWTIENDENGSDKNSIHGTSTSCYLSILEAGIVGQYLSVMKKSG